MKQGIIHNAKGDFENNNITVFGVTASGAYASAEFYGDGRVVRIGSKPTGGAHTVTTIYWIDQGTTAEIAAQGALDVGIWRIDWVGINGTGGSGSKVFTSTSSLLKFSAQTTQPQQVDHQNYSLTYVNTADQSKNITITLQLDADSS